MTDAPKPTSTPKLSRRARILGVTLMTTGVALAAPVLASAADRWVDTDTGSDAGGNQCLSAASPCATINQAVFAGGMNAGDPDTIHADQGTYVEAVNIGQNMDLVPDDFVAGDGGGSWKIAPTGVGVALFVQGSATVTGFEISDPASSTVVLVSDNAKLLDSTVTAAAANSTAIDARNGAPTVDGNTVIAESGDEKIGVLVQGTSTDALITGNKVGAAGVGFAYGISGLANAVATIEDNEIRGTHQDLGIRGKGILLKDVAAVTVSRNLITSPKLTANDESYGIEVNGVATGASVALDHNRILAMTGIGLSVLSVTGNVTSEGDLIAANSDRAVYVGNVDGFTITNDTITGNQPMIVNTASVTIDSSILDVGITAEGSQAFCDITYSRGPAITADASGCGAFQTAANPQFVDTNTFDYHLQQDSPLIDAGNPAPPAAGAVDIDGDPRALEGDGQCPFGNERDMGIDEVVRTVADCPDPPVVDETAPETSVRGKRKQFGRKARFTFASSEAGSTFECRLDRGKFRPCDAKFKSRRLNYGRHTVFARATDAAGNTDASAEAVKFKMKKKRPAA